MDPAEADYFVVPAAGGLAVRRIAALRFAAARWPFFNASVAEGGPARHVFPTVCDDGGLIKYNDVAQLLVRAGRVGAGRPWTDALAALPELKYSVFLTCNGLHMGQARAPATRHASQ